jgi:hypothetical protein
MTLLFVQVAILMILMGYLGYTFGIYTERYRGDSDD